MWHNTPAFTPINECGVKAGFKTKSSKHTLHVLLLTDLLRKKEWCLTGEKEGGRERAKKKERRWRRRKEGEKEGREGREGRGWRQSGRKEGNRLSVYALNTGYIEENNSHGRTQNPIHKI